MEAFRIPGKVLELSFNSRLIFGRVQNPQILFGRILYPGEGIAIIQYPQVGATGIMYSKIGAGNFIHKYMSVEILMQLTLGVGSFPCVYLL